jgi:ABC-type antimicrobial peptide transport system permease subunit
VNRAFASRFLDGRALGESLEIGERWVEVVGVVGDVRTFGLREDARPMVYLPLGNASVGVEMMLTVVRTSVASSSFASSLRSAVDSVDSSVPLTTVRTMDQIVATSLAQTSFTMILLATAAGIALVLGVVGLYGVISYIVTQRTAEIGIRLALGARPLEVCVLVLRQGLVVALGGVAVGLLVALASTRWMASLLFGVSAHDPATFVAAALLLTVVSAAATYLPARRAAMIDPIQALRQDG